MAKTIYETTICPLLNVKWKIIENHSRVRPGNVILLGKWYEDDNDYIMEVPEQLAESLCKLQHHFVDRYHNRQKAKNDVRELDHELFGSG